LLQQRRPLPRQYALDRGRSGLAGAYVNDEFSAHLELSPKKQAGSFLKKEQKNFSKLRG
jgi:hypothetical protein